MIHLHTFRRRFMTLVELLVGIGLTMLILTVLTFFFKHVETSNAVAESIQKDTFYLHYVETRLAKILPKAIDEINGKPMPFFTSGDLGGTFETGMPSLIFMFDNGTDIDPKRAGINLGCLFIDKQKRLCLATWPHPDEWEQQLPKARLEVLLDNVTNLKLKFYVVPDRDRTLVPREQRTGHTSPSPQGDSSKKSGSKDTSKPTEEKNNELKDSQEAFAPQRGNDPWKPDWSRDFQHLPAMIKIEIERKKTSKSDEKLVFAYPLSQSKKVIIYEQ